MDDQNLQIIKAFLQKMAEQDNRATASPFYYVIRTKVEEEAPLHNCDKKVLYWNEENFDSLDELIAYLDENGYSDEEIADATLLAGQSGIKYRWVRKGMFLTESDAEAHLQANHYHYSADAHTYVEHAWRAPELTRFVNALMEHFEIEQKR